MYLVFLLNGGLGVTLPDANVGIDMPNAANADWYVPLSGALWYDDAPSVSTPLPPPAAVEATKEGCVGKAAGE